MTVHKLIALASVVMAFIAVRRLLVAGGGTGVGAGTRLSGTVLVLAVVSVLSAITLFATGALLSSGKTMPGYVPIIHNVATGLAPLAVGAMVLVR